MRYNVVTKSWATYVNHANFIIQRGKLYLWFSINVETTTLQFPPTIILVRRISSQLIINLCPTIIYIYIHQGFILLGNNLNILQTRRSFIAQRRKYGDEVTSFFGHGNWPTSSRVCHCLRLQLRRCTRQNIVVF